MSALRTVFAGSPAFAATILQALCHTPYKPQAVFTQPERSAGRRKKGGAVKNVAEAQQIPIEQPSNLSSPDDVARLAAYKPDVFIVAAYGLILPPAVLAIPRLDCVNVHASLLPRWRGAAPIERAIMAGDHETGVCIMSMEAGLDTGPVYRHASTRIDAAEGAQSLEERLAVMGAKSLIEVLDDIARATQDGTPLPLAKAQPEEGVTYAHKITASDRTVNWQVSAAAVALQVRALADREPARCTIDLAGDSVGVHLIEAAAMHLPDSGQTPGTIIAADKQGIDVQCATDVLRITRLRIVKGKGTILSAADALNGYAEILAVTNRLN